MLTRSFVLKEASLAGTGVARDLPKNFIPDPLGPTAFDHTTLWYAAVWQPHPVLPVLGGRLGLITPSLVNLAEVIRTGPVLLDGVPARFQSIQDAGLYCIVWFGARRQPREVAIEVGGKRLATGVFGPDAADFLAGQNTAVILSRNNDLRLIHDFARYHRVVHGLEAVLFFDNGSDRYGVPEIIETLERAGMARTLLVSAPQLYGTFGSGPEGQRKFSGASLQTALLNFARLSLVPRARAVLQCDIDEMVWCARGTIFEAAQQSSNGFVHIPGEWVYADPALGEDTTHADHTQRAQPAHRSPAKYCVRPDTRYARTSWAVHRLADRKLDTMAQTDGVGFWHCRMLSPKARQDARGKSVTKETVPADDFQAALAKAGLA